MSSLELFLKKHPSWEFAQQIIQLLQQAGYEAVLAGGCVRDAILGKIAKDLDIASSAHPDEVLRLMAAAGIKTVEVGKSFGVIRAVDGHNEIEVATFRNDGDYLDGRRPETVQFSSIQEDALRRDFTINALFYDLSKKQVLDFVQGVTDIHKHVIQTVGDAKKRFDEDKLRILRAIRFQSQLGFSIEPLTMAAMQKYAHQLNAVSAERIQSEVSLLLLGDHLEMGMKSFVDSGVVKAIFPELKPSVAVDIDATQILKGITKSEVWAMFALELRKNSLNFALKDLRFSNPEAEFLRKFLAYEDGQFSFSASVDKISLGEAISQINDNEALRFWLSQRSGPAILQKAFQEWVSYGGAFPVAFISGEDINHLNAQASQKISGQKFGQILKDSFWLQLEKKLKTREESLAWLDKNKSKYLPDPA